MPSLTSVPSCLPFLDNLVFEMGSCDPCQVALPEWLSWRAYMRQVFAARNVLVVGSVAAIVVRSTMPQALLNG